MEIQVTAHVLLLLGCKIKFSSHLLYSPEIQFFPDNLAEHSSMEVLAPVVAAIGGEAGRSCFGSLCSTIHNAREFHPDYWELCIKDLLDLRDYVKHQVESADQEGRSPGRNVRKWLIKVEKLEPKASKIRARLTPENRRLCGCGFGFGLVLRFQAARVLLKAEKLHEEGSFPDGLVSKNFLVKTAEHWPGPSIEDGTTASGTLALLSKKLEDNESLRIGVWGLGGVGKTTLVKNLNNKLNTATSNRPFSVVIWVTVSKELDLKRVQMKIAERLNLEVRLEDSVDGTASRLHQRLSREKFLLILDDLWQSIDLDDLGVPQPESHKGSKILLTSRSLDVCRQMMADDVVKMDILGEDEAWDLFLKKAGNLANLQQINPFAKALARECCGLPLALVTMGTAMRGKARVELWKHALKELQTSVPCINGTTDKVYNSLKWSYDVQSDENTKSCFLFCSLYPEDFSIEISELVQCWLAEGLIDGHQSIEESVNTGIAVVQNLKDSCLLEDGDREGSVKMHDVVRDVAIWIASFENGCRSLCRSGAGLSEIAVAVLQDSSLKRVSFANNEITNLPDCKTRWSKVSTLLLQGNLSLEEVPKKFLQGFQALRVLNMGRTRIRSLPTLAQLSNLRALLLADCFSLVEISALGTLRELRVLDLCGTRIRELPKGMGESVSLRQVNLSRTHYLKKIPAGVISKWTSLEVLDMSLSGYQWRFEEEGQASFEELRFLKWLHTLSIRVKKLPDHSSMNSIGWMSRLRRFQCFVGEATNALPTTHDQRRVIISMLDVSAEWVVWFMANSTSLVLNSCDRLSSALPSLDAFSDLSRATRAGDFEALKSLTITASTCQFSPRQSRASAGHDLLPNLEELRLHNLRDLKSITEIADHLGLLFSKLTLVEIVNCHQMMHLLSCGNEILALPALEILKVSHCNMLSTLFDQRLSYQDSLSRLSEHSRNTNHSLPSHSRSSRAEGPVVPNLRTLELKKLPKLVTLCRSDQSWPRLEQISVFQCYRLSRLPVTTQNAKTIKVIRGESKWWNKLIWDHSNTCQDVQQSYRFGTVAKYDSPVLDFNLRIKRWVSSLPVKLQSIEHSD